MARAVAEIIAPTDLDDVPDGTTYKRMSATEQTKLGGIDENAKDDQTGLEVQGLITALSDAEKELVVSEPQTGEYRIYGIHRNAAGNPEYDYEDQAEV